MSISTLTQVDQCIHQGLLQKRCRLSWRPRHVELISDPSDMAGHLYSFQLLIYDPRKRILKDKIRMESVVTIRASRDCHFQIFLSDGKIVQFRTETIASQCHWIAMLKMGLGRGNIFHVVLNSVSEVEHALLFSVGVNLPPHRTGQLDRVLVLASPINDINLHAWDLNRVTRFIELDIGIRVELCPSCVRGQTTTLTFVIERQFVKDCMSFLRKEAHISTPPIDNHGLMIHNVSHHCFFTPPPSHSAPPPPYTESEGRSLPRKRRVKNKESAANGAVRVQQVTSREGIGAKSHCQLRSEPSCPLPVSSDVCLSSMWEDSPASQSESFMTTSSLQKQHNEPASNDRMSFMSDLPPRTIPRPDFESSPSAKAQPYLDYHPRIYSSSGNWHFEPPYHVSNRIVITESGEIQLERNVTGSYLSGDNRRLQGMLVPPRGLGADANSKVISTKVTLEAHTGELHDYVNTKDLRAATNQRRSSCMGPFETREYVNFPVSTTPPPTAKNTYRYPHRISRTNSDSELNYSAASKSRAKFDAPGTAKRASQVSVSSDVYIIPRVRSPLPGHLPFISSTLAEDGSLTAHELCLEHSASEQEHQGHDHEYVNVPGSGATLYPQPQSVLGDDKNNNCTSAPSVDKPQDEVEEPKTPVPLPRRKPTISTGCTGTKGNNTLPPQSFSKDDSYVRKQKPPIPRPRTKTSVKVSVDVSLWSDEHLEKPMKLRSKSVGFYTDEHGVGVSDV